MASRVFNNRVTFQYDFGPYSINVLTSFTSPLEPHYIQVTIFPEGHGGAIDPKKLGITSRQLIDAFGTQLYMGYPSKYTILRLGMELAHVLEIDVPADFLNDFS